MTKPINEMLDKSKMKTLEQLKHNGEYLRRLYTFHKNELDRIHERIIENDQEIKELENASGRKV